MNNCISARVFFEGPVAKPVSGSLLESSCSALLKFKSVSEAGASTALSLFLGSSEGRAASAEKGMGSRSRQHSQRLPDLLIMVSSSINDASPLA